ncbi:Pyridoxal-5'-phosphate-dependent protein beta subunit [Halovivax asiaticus JCM 14624]|uniref:Pyridoxal-5'-phosphate-dependent protein beta subunit n=1 Tax=Halovivax asiaticus JCM 14624 TaxID=1227490 RepID=M0BF60_9EURY|nr:pyridoxal-phosphate dependent enzyme [Halovivax asiaticus]ELZ09480.1 Pyridoxal-5'-phosphate-dependent protein beta subunit [Halovivax asiaticus JCM 14624]
MASDLVCPDCDAVYEAGPDEPWRCGCGHALEFVDRPYPEGHPRPLSSLDTSRGLWTFFEFLPIEEHVTFHEGFTPLVDAPEWNADFKLEYVFPSGSFKDRGATTTLSRAVELGVEKVIEDSSGNAGAAIATYAARAGLPADIYVPEDVKQSKLMAIQRVDARPVRVPGSREDVTAACVDAVEGARAATGNQNGAAADREGSDGHPNPADGHPDAPYQTGRGWYASHAWNPAFYAGTMTFAFEIAAQREWSAPDALVLPIGHGTLFLGAYRGFDLLREAGITDTMPRLLGVQSVGYDPIVTVVDGDRVVEEGESEAAIADGIQIREPARGSQIVEAIEATDGTAIGLGDGAVENALDRLHRGGFYVEPTTAVAPAALAHLRELGHLDEDEDVVVPLTGSGLKTM